MSFRRTSCTLLLLLGLLLSTLVSCSPPPTPTPEPTTESPALTARITVSGTLFDAAALRDLEVTVTAKTPKGEENTYTGISLLPLLNKVGLEEGDLLLIASDGYQAEVAFADLNENCLLAYNDQDGFDAVMPGLGGGVWVRDIVEIHPAGQATAAPVITVNGKDFSIDDLKALEQISQTVEGTTYEGVRLLDVLEAAGVTSGSLLLVATDGYEAGVSVDALTPDCMLAYEPTDTVGAVMPGQSRGLWVKSLAEITVDTEASASSDEPVSSSPKPITGETQVVVDSLDKEVTIPAEVSRVASMRSGITEIICALGQADKIIVVDEMVKAGESYGEFIAKVHPELAECVAPFRNRDINAEELLRTEPDVVLHGGYGRISQAEALQKQVPDLPIVIAHFETIEDYMDDVRIVGQCVNAEEAAEKLITTLQGTLDFVSERVSDIPEKDKVRVFYGGHDIYHAYTSTTFEHAQIVMAGGVNVAGELEGWLPEVSSEELLVWDPEVIVVLNGVDVQAILDDPKVQGVSAVKNKRVYALPEASWDFSSPRALFCIEWLAHKLYPEQFADIDIEAEADAFYLAVFGVEYDGPALGDGRPITTAQRTITDMIGRKVQIPNQVKRVVTLHSDITASVLALGGEKQLAAVDSMSATNENLKQVFPRVNDLPAPCAFFNANPESILEVEPDMVLTVSWQQTPDKLQQQMNVPVVCVDLNLYEPSIRFLANILGAKSRADEICGYYTDRIDSIRDALQGMPKEKRTRVYVAGGDGLMSTYGAESTWHYEILDAGGVNVAAGLKGGGAHGMSMEQIMLWDPQVVILDASCPDDVTTVLSDARWKGISAVKAKRVYRASPGLVGPWGRPHLESALARVWLADKLYPEVLDLDMLAEARTFYQRLYGREFSDSELKEILGE